MTQNQITDKYSIIRNSHINLNFLDESRNHHLKEFYYIKLSAQQQSDLIGLLENDFKKVIVNLYNKDIRKQKLKDINRNPVTKFFTNMFKSIFR